MKLADQIFRRNDWKLTSRFGPRKDPITGAQAQHKGADYGTGGQKWPLHAIEDGVVVSCGADSSRGKYVEVHYPRIGKRLTHYHLDSVSVKNGQAVREGTVLGTTGSTGRSTGVHLHLGLRSGAGGAWEDPHAYEYKPRVASKPQAETKPKAKTTAAQQEFIDRVGKTARAGSAKSGILPSLVIAQAILESGWGQSGLTQKANALFGIKAGPAWKGPRVDCKTFEYVDAQRVDTTAAFRAYGSWEESIADHSALLRGASRYKAVLGERDYKKACRAVHEAGYATAPDYADYLIRLIEQYGLTAWDAQQPSVQEKPAAEEPGYTMYTVASDKDTLWALAARFLGSGTRWPEISALNGNVDPKRIYVGMKLKIPRKSEECQ